MELQIWRDSLSYLNVALLPSKLKIYTLNLPPAMCYTEHYAQAKHLCCIRSKSKK